MGGQRSGCGGGRFDVGGTKIDEHTIRQRQI